MAERRRRWLPIAAGIAILLAFAAIGGIIFLVSYVNENLDVEASSPASAEEAFAEVHARFNNRPPLLELRDGTPHYTTDHGREPSNVKLDRFHVLAWDPEEAELARFSLPFWFLRLKSEPIQISSYAAGWDDGGVSLKTEDIEKYGPGVVLDINAPGQERVLIWVE